MIKNHWVLLLLLATVPPGSWGCANGAGIDDDSADDDHNDDDASDDDDSGNHSYACSPVGASDSDGFFSLRSFDGKLYAGQFGYGHEGTSMLYSYPAWELVQPGLTGIGESVCAMLEFDGQLYANTENSGDIYRSADGSSWQIVYDGDAGTIGCGLEAFDGQLYAISYQNQDGSHGRILRTSSGTEWSTVWDSGDESWYLREITSHQGTLYGFFVDEGSLQGSMLTSTNGTDWTSTPVDTRFFRGHSWNGDLWLASADRTSSGVSGIWRLDGDTPVLVHQANKHYVTEITHWDNALFAGTADGWKEDEGTSSLLMSSDGAAWQTVCEFDEIAAWSVAVHGDNLYVGTWQYGHGGQVYIVEIVEDPGDDDDGDDDDDDDGEQPVDCSQISQANPAWEVCDTTDDTCAGVFTDGAGCAAYCAAAGLVCTARYGGEPGCQPEYDNPLSCNDNNGHQSDWCVCGRPDDPGDDDDTDGCHSDPYDPPTTEEQGHYDAVYGQRHNWVLDCYPYAYTASSAEHQECDPQFQPDGSRTGTATFTFYGVPRGMYDTYMGGRHTENRNASGALFIVDGHAQIIDQQDDSGDYLWDYHGQYCLEGDVDVVLDSTVNGGSDSVMGVRLVPAP